MKLGFLVVFIIMWIFTPLAVAQQAKKIPRIAYLASTNAATNPLAAAFREGLRELGYIDGKTIVIEYWYTQGREERLPELTAEIVRSKPDLIVASGSARAQALKEATSTIPVVVTSAGDLVGRGVVRSLARPGGNITGLTTSAPDLSGKRLEILKEIIPSATRVAVLYYTYEEDELRQTSAAARRLSIQVQGQVVSARDQLPTIFASINKADPQALLIFSSSFTNFHRKDILERAIKRPLPTMCDGREWVDHGCLVSYSPSRLDLYRRAAAFVDKIAKGHRPEDLPIEQPTKFELAINMKTAKQLGLTISPNLLTRTDHLVK